MEVRLSEVYPNFCTAGKYKDLPRIMSCGITFRCGFPIKDESGTVDLDNPNQEPCVIFFPRLTLKDSKHPQGVTLEDTFVVLAHGDYNPISQEWRFSDEQDIVTFVNTYNTKYAKENATPPIGVVIACQNQELDIGIKNSNLKSVILWILGKIFRKPWLSAISDVTIPFFQAEDNQFPIVSALGRDVKVYSYAAFNNKTVSHWIIVIEDGEFFRLDEYKEVLDTMGDITI